MTAQTPDAIVTRSGARAGRASKELTHKGMSVPATGAAPGGISRRKGEPAGF